MANLVDPSTGRPAWTGPQGQPGSASPFPGGTATYTMPDGRTAYYDPTATPAAGNVQALQGAGVLPTAKAPTPPAGGTDSATQAALQSLTAEVNSLQAQGQANTQQQQQNALEAVEGAMPWLAQMGLTDQIKQWVIQGYTDPSALTALVRQTPQWQQMFPGIRRADGTMRYDEATYQKYNDAYRDLLKSFGKPGVDYSTPDSLAAFHAQDITPDDLKTRLDTYDQIAKGSTDVKAAFYVYAGIPVSDDDLYRATVDPDYNQQLQTAYHQAVTLQPPDYGTFITRTTEFGLNQVAAKMTQAGVTSGAVNSLYALQPDAARQLMDQLYHGGNPQAPAAPGQAGPGPSGMGRYLTLSELQHAFEAALIGGAATLNGLEMPNQERIAELRQAGVDRAKALEVFGDVGAHGSLYSGEGLRAGLGALDQSTQEDALFKLNGHAMDLLQRAQDFEKSLGERESNVDIRESDQGRMLQQTGFEGRY